MITNKMVAAAEKVLNQSGALALPSCPHDLLVREMLQAALAVSSKKVKPETESEFRELGRLLALYPDATVEINRVLDEGAPFIRAKIGAPVAAGTVGRIVGMELPAWLKAHLHALRARNANPNAVTN